MALLDSMRARKGFFFLSASVIAVDQASKLAAHALLASRGPVAVVPGFFSLWYSRNRGGLFGYFASLSDPWRGALLTLLPMIAIVMIAAFLAKTDETSRPTLLGLSLILGGAVGNLIDRVARGEVIDFLDVYASSPSLADRLVARFGTAHWPTFNLADSAIVVGAGLLVLDVLRPAGRGAATPDMVTGDLPPEH
jgi:signal peptidase II